MTIYDSVYTCRNFETSASTQIYDRAALSWSILANCQAFATTSSGLEEMVSVIEQNRKEDACTNLTT
jgi:hypothetical protein